MKKRLALLLVLLILLSAIVSCESTKSPNSHTEEGNTSTEALITSDTSETTTDQPDTTSGTAQTSAQTEPSQTEPIITEHVHSFGTEWKTDEDSHWHVCSCGEKSPVAAHSFGDWVITKAATEQTDGTEYRICADCGYIEDNIIQALGHIHKFGNEWQTDDVKHWRVCECGETTDNAAHTFGEWIVNIEATCLENGSRYRACSVCGKRVSEVIPVKEHTIVTDQAVAATCTTQGWTAGSHCSVCGTVLKAQEKVSSLGHDYVNEICSRCGRNEYFGRSFITQYDAVNAEKIAPGKTNEDMKGKIIPLAGYKYDENGFHTISPQYTANPFTQFAAAMPFDLTTNNDAEGCHVFSVTFTVDEFAYKGTTGADEWICFSITDKQASTPGAPSYQDGLFILCRGSGNGSVQFQPFFDVDGTFENRSGSFTTKNIPVNADGKEVYTFYIDYAEGKWTISIKLADETVFPIGLTEDMKVNSKNLNDIFEGFKDEAYFQITAQTGYFDRTDADKNNVSFTVNSYNGQLPVGKDSRDPVSN